MLRIKLYGNGKKDVLLVSPGVSKTVGQEDLVSFCVGDHGWVAISYADLLRMADAATAARGKQGKLGEAEGVTSTLRDNIMGSVDVTIQFQGEQAEQVRKNLHLLQRVGLVFAEDQAVAAAVRDAHRVWTGE